MFLQLWPVVRSVNKATNCGSQSHGQGKKLEEEAISEILVANASSETGVEASDLKTILRKKKSSKPQQKSP